MTRVTVLPRRRFRGWNGDMPPDAPPADVVGLRSAMEATYRSDACIVQYAPPDPDRTSFFRLNKTSLGYFEMTPAEMPNLEVALVDVDTPDKEPPAEGWAADVWSRSPWPGGWYRTPNGLRLVYITAKLVPINLADSYLDQLHAELREAGIPTDTGTRDWTRLFVAPRAAGRDYPMDLSGLAPIEWHPDNLVPADPLSIGPIVSRDVDTVVEAVPDRITRADVKPISNRRLAESIYNGTLAAPVGMRHDTLLKAARAIVRGYDTDDPMIPFNLLHASAMAMGKPVDEVWRICEWCAAHYSGMRAERKAARLAAVDEAAECMGAPRVEVPSRIIVDTGKEQFIWDEDRKEYSTGYTHAHQLLGALQRHAPNLAYGYYDGTVSREEIMRDLSVVADRVVYTYRESPTGYDSSTYTFYRRVCRPDRSLVPTYHEDVAEWLDALFGEEIENGLDWLASVPRLDQPTCALYVRGPNTIGKGMLAEGISRVWSRECAVTPYMELIGEFNPTLLRSPLILADEKVPQDAFQTNDSSIFRRIIGNGAIRVRDLHKTPATLNGYPRVLITANNEDALAIREELSNDDLDAIRIRIGYINTDHRAVEVLEEIAERGEYDRVRDATDSWVAGGRIAEHVLWLAANREVEWGDRFLVEGWESDLTQSLATAAGSTGAVAEVIAMRIAEKADMDGEEIRWFGGKIYVNNAGLGRAWESIIEHRNEKPPRSSNRLKALKALSRENRTRLDVATYGISTERRQLSYWMIDSKVIARLAHERNICPKDLILERCSREVEPSNTPTTLNLADETEKARCEKH